MEVYGSKPEMRCTACGGTGVDRAKTDAMYKRESSSTGYVRCWTCNGNGLDPSYFFRSSNEHLKY